MRINECYCAYHTNQIQHLLTDKMENMNMALPTANQNSTVTTNYERKEPNRKNGMKRNFQTTDTHMDQEGNNNRIEQVRKRTKSNLNGTPTQFESMDPPKFELMDCDDSKQVVEEMNQQTLFECTHKPSVGEHIQPCVRCQNGEPGHYNHLTSSNAHYTQNQYSSYSGW